MPEEKKESLEKSSQRSFENELKGIPIENIEKIASLMVEKLNEYSRKLENESFLTPYKIEEIQEAFIQSLAEKAGIKNIDIESLFNQAPGKTLDSGSNGYDRSVEEDYYFMGEKIISITCDGESSDYFIKPGAINKDNLKKAIGKFLAEYTSEL